MNSLFRKFNLHIRHPANIRLKNSVINTLQENNRSIYTNERNYKRRHLIIPICLNTQFNRFFLTTKMDSNLLDVKSTFPEIVQELTDVVKEYTHEKNADRISEAVKYNIPHGKKIRGNFVTSTFTSLVEDASPEQIKLAHYLGWCVELLHGAINMADDIFDESETRRGQPCWYKLENVGLEAIRDVVQIQYATFALLKKHFRHLNCYRNLVDLFHEVGFLTCCGQSQDVLLPNKGIDSFTTLNNKVLSVVKSSYISFYLPIVAALYLSEHKDVVQQVKPILMEMGYLFQLNNDFLDCFGDPEITGKIGTDIQCNKCTWFAAKCMENANDEQKAIMRECYGQYDPDKVKQIKELYMDLELPQKYRNYEKESHKRMETEIRQLPYDKLKDFLLQVMKDNFNRKS